METKAIYMNEKMYIDGTFNDLKIKNLSAICEVIADSVLYNSTSYIERKKDSEVRYEAKGNCTEQGLIRFFLNQCGESLILTK
jgi:hypothetical protein